MKVLRCIVTGTQEKKAKMNGKISIHNSAAEMAETPELIRTLQIQQLAFEADGHTLPYCQRITCGNSPGEPVLAVFLHGIGSVGHDNFLQIRIPAAPMVRYCENRGIKAVLLFPQCEQGYQWVNVPWNSRSHVMPEVPSLFQSLAMGLVRAKITEFKPDLRRIYGLGISMGGYGIWDMACRMNDLFAAIAVMCGGADTSQAPNLRHVAAFLIHGADDSAVPVLRARDMFEAMRRAGNPDVVYRELPGVNHNVWDPFFADDKGLDWLFAQRRSLS